MSDQATAFLATAPLSRGTLSYEPHLVSGVRAPLFFATRSRRAARLPSTVRMQLSVGRPALYAGAAVLAAVLVNRLVLTPLDSLAMTQSRSDILGVITGATLVLYGVGKAEITDKRAAVELEGVDVRQGLDDAGADVEWAADAVRMGLPNVKSFAYVERGAARAFAGRFRQQVVPKVPIVEGGIIEGALRSGNRAYLADMKVVPVKETEFGFLPQNCQAVIIQPISSTRAFILGADKPRPLTGADFGWVQAVANRLGDAEE